MLDVVAAPFLFTVNILSQYEPVCVSFLCPMLCASSWGSCLFCFTPLSVFPNHSLVIGVIFFFGRVPTSCCSSCPSRKQQQHACSGVFAVVFSPFLNSLFLALSVLPPVQALLLEDKPRLRAMQAEFVEGGRYHDAFAQSISPDYREVVRETLERSFPFLFEGGQDA